MLMRKQSKLKKWNYAKTFFQNLQNFFPKSLRFNLFLTSSITFTIKSNEYLINKVNLKKEFIFSPQTLNVLHFSTSNSVNLKNFHFKKFNS